MNERVRELLLDAVPPLPTPADRIEAIGQRYRRRRRGTATATALAIALVVGIAVGVPQLANREGLQQPAGPATGPTTCPETTQDRAGREWVEAGTRGPVPGNPVEVVACDVESQDPEYDPVTGDLVVRYPAKAPPRVLSGGEDVVAALNGVSAVTSCPSVSVHRQPVFIVRYADRPAVFVSLNLTCRLDESWDAPVRVFLSSFRAQQVASTDAADVPTPGCDAPTFAVTGWLGFRWYAAPEWTAPLVNGRLIGEPPLPVEPVATTICRYAYEAPDGRLLASKSVRGGVDDLRGVINDPRTTVDVCESYAEATIIDIVKVADRGGSAPIEMAVFRGPACEPRGVQPPPLLTAIDEIVGPVN